MGYVKWFCALVGFMYGRFWGGVMGYLIGSAIESMLLASPKSMDDRYDRYQTRSPREGFMYSLMILSAHIIQADGKIMHSEMEFMRRFIRENFGESTVAKGEKILKDCFSLRKSKGEAVWRTQLDAACGRIAQTMPSEHRLQLISFLAEVAKADGTMTKVEQDALRQIASALGLNPGVVDQLFAMGGNSLEDDYKVLGISPDATDEEVRQAYRKMVIQYHPDKVATLGDDVKEAATRKIQEIKEAKERIYRARNMR